MSEKIDSLDRVIRLLERSKPRQLPWRMHIFLVVALLTGGILHVWLRINRDLKKLTVHEFREKYWEQPNLIRKREKNQALSFRDFRDYLRVTFSSGNTLAFLFHMVGTHPFLFLVVVAFLIVVFSYHNYDITLLAILGFFISFISAYYASRSDYSAKRAQNISGQSYEKANLAMSSIMNFSDDLAGFVERLKSLHQRLLDEQRHFTIKFVTVIPAFGRVGLDDIIPEFPSYYRRMKEAHGPSYETWHDFLLRLLKDHNSGKIKDQIYAKLKMLTHDGLQLTTWITNILKASRIVEGTSHKVESVVQQQVKEQLKYVKDLHERVGDRYFRIKSWPQIGEAPASIPFQFVLVKDYIECDDSSLPEQNVEGPYAGSRLMFLFSGDYIYNHLLKYIEEQNKDLSMQDFVRFTKGYYSEDRDVIKFFDRLFDFVWSKANLIERPE